MKLRTILQFLPVILFVCACNTKTNQGSAEIWKKEIVETEKKFADMVAKEGISKAFLAYADDNAVLMRDNTVYVGKEAISERFNRPDNKDHLLNLSWKPDFVDVSSSGDLGYTYGKFVYSLKDSVGETAEHHGIFHTVWKRQADGQWKFVWD